MENRGSNCITSIRIVNLQNTEEIRFIENIPHDVSQRVLQLAREIGAEGREGKPVGCLFVVGSEDILNDYTHQLIVNPFSGYPEAQRNIIDPSLEETIKEFLQNRRGHYHQTRRYNNIRRNLHCYFTAETGTSSG